MYYDSRAVPDMTSLVLLGPTAPLYSRVHMVELDWVDDSADDAKGCVDTSAAVDAMAVDVEGKTSRRVDKRRPQH